MIHVDGNTDDDCMQSGHATMSQRLTTLAAVLLPLAGLVAAVWCSWGWGFTWIELALLVGMYTTTGLGVTVGFHRLFAHRSFATFRVVKISLAVLGSMSVQGTLLKWVAMHRRHHQYSDQTEDPHSPHRFGGGVWGVLAGLWHAHVGWMFKSDPPNLSRYVRDLESDRLLNGVSRLFGCWVFLGLFIPTVFGALLTGTWTGAFLGFLWGGLARIFLLHHVTWSINSICHLWGQRRFEGRDRSTNNFVCGVLAFGEGWHNNHHAFPNSARHGLAWWEVDLSYLVIRILNLLGLAWHVRVPAPETVATRRIQRSVRNASARVGGSAKISPLRMSRLSVVVRPEDGLPIGVDASDSGLKRHNGGLHRVTWKGKRDATMHDARRTRMIGD